MSKTAEVFEALSRGGFICSNAVKTVERDLFRYEEEHEERWSFDHSLILH